MADITKMKNDLYLGNPSTPTNTSLKLARSCSATDVTIYFNFEPKDKTWASITNDIYIWVKKSNWFVETMLVTDITWTVITVTRWINPNWLDLTTWNASFTDTHDAWEPVIFAIPAVFMQQIVSFLTWAIWSWANSIKIWDWADSDIYFYAFNADWTKPYVRYDAWDNKWYFSNDWVTDLDLASWWVSTASNWVQIVASDISLNLDTNSWLKINSNKVRIDENDSYKYYTSTTWNDTYVITTHAWVSSYSTWMSFRFKTDVANTWACSLNVDWLWAKTIKNKQWSDLTTWDISANDIITIIYDWTNFVLQKETNSVVNTILSTYDFLQSFYFWEWSDWDVTISSWTTTLTRDMFYNNLTISWTWVLNPNWYKVYVKWTLVNGVAWWINRNNSNNWATWSWSSWWAAWAVLNQWSLNAEVLWWAWWIGATSQDASWNNWNVWSNSNPSFVNINWTSWWNWSSAVWGWGWGAAWWTATRWALYNIVNKVVNVLSVWLMFPASSLANASAIWQPDAQATRYVWLPWWGWWWWGWMVGRAGFWAVWGWGWWAWWNGWVIWISANTFNNTWTITATWATWWNGTDWWVDGIYWQWWGWWGWAWWQWWTCILIYKTLTNLWTITLTWWAWWIKWIWWNENWTSWATWATWATIQIAI